MDGRLKAVISYTVAFLIGLPASCLVSYLLWLIVPPGPQPAAPLIIIGVLVVVYAGLGAIFGFASPTSFWVVLGVCLGASWLLLILFSWSLADPTPMSVTDILLLATPIFAACGGAYGGARLRRRLRSMRESRAEGAKD